MFTKPRWLLHLEGAAILGLAVFLYQLGQYHWWLFAVLLLSPDLFMLGYTRNAAWGAAIYNLVHTVTGPLLLLGIALAVGAQGCIPYALIWLAHIGMDRALGYGLKSDLF